MGKNIIRKGYEMITENSNDLLTTFKLLDEEDAEFIKYGRFPNYIYVGKFTKKEHHEIFNFCN